MLEVLGSRKPVVFVEGENGSYDVALYRAILPNFLVVPRGSCSQVIISVKALKANPQLHHLNVFGLIDKDRRVPEEIAILETESIFTISVAEVENLFCTKEVVELVSRRLAHDPIADFQAVSDKVFERLQQELDIQVSLQVASEIRFQLSRFEQRTTGEEALANALHSLLEGIDVATLYREWKERFNETITTRNYQSLLAIYNIKSLATQISSVFGLKSGELSELAVRLARTECRDEMKAALLNHLGNFATELSRYP